MKKIYDLIICFAAVIFLTCCGTSAPVSSETGNTSEPADTTATAKEPEEEKEYYDEDFLTDFSEAIQARWDKSEEDDKNKVPHTKESLLEFINIELAFLEPKDYRNKKYKDTHLHEDVLLYLNALDEQKAIMDSISDLKTDMKGEVQSRWQTATNKRYEIIADLYDNYDLKIDSRHIYGINRTHNTLYIKNMGKKHLIR